MGVLKPHLGVPVTLSLALLVGCVPDFDDDLSIVVAPRVLAVRAEPAEAKPNEVVTLSALVVDPDPLAPPAPAHFALCVDRKPIVKEEPTVHGLPHPSRIHHVVVKVGLDAKVERTRRGAHPSDKTREGRQERGDQRQQPCKPLDLRDTKVLFVDRV